MWFYGVPKVCAVADLRCCNTLHTGSRILYAYYVILLLSVGVGFPKGNVPHFMFRSHVTTSPAFPQCGDLSTRFCVHLLIVVIYTKIIASVMRAPQMYTHKFKFPTRDFFLPSLCSVSKFSNCIALYYGLYVEFLMKEAKTKCYSGCVQILETINITQMR